MRQFSSAEYEAAAQAFLAADELVPNSRALINGISAARRAGLHLIVARAAERALARSDMDPGGAALAREALVAAARNLTRVDLSCAPEPCTITLDGSAISAGPTFVLPGTHDFVGAGANGASVTEHLSCAAGAAYRVILTPKVPGASPENVPPAPPPQSASGPRAESPSGTARFSETPPSKATETAAKPLSPAVFVAGAVGTATLVALTTWSGIDTLSAKSEAQGDSGKWPHVQRLALRTDLFLVGSVVLGAATGVAGLWFVDWGSGKRATAMWLPGGGAVFAAEGQF